MKNLWAPWRIKYIKSKKATGCIFCKAAKNKKNDKKNYVFIRSKTCIALLNIYPYNNGHAMIATKRHFNDINRLTALEQADIFKLLKDVKIRLDNILKPQGYNIGINIGQISGAGIADHLHLHIVPRWSADTNFMPVVFNTKVIAQSLKELYKELCQR